MNFNRLMNFASERQKTVGPTKKYSTEASVAKREKRDRPKGVQSAAVRAFLEKKEMEEKKKESEERQKKQAQIKNLFEKRAEAKTQKKANAMASRTKDVPKVFNFDGTMGKERVATVTDEQERIRREMQEKLQRINDKMKAGKYKSKSIVDDDDGGSDKNGKPREKPGQFKSKHTISDDEFSSDDELEHELNTSHPPGHKPASALDTLTRYKSDPHHSSKHKHSDKSHKHHDKHKDKHKHEDKHKHKHDKDKHKHKDRHKDVKHTAKDPKPTDAAKKPDVKPKPKPKPKPPRRSQGPPPMSFEQMLAVAKNNQAMGVSTVVTLHKQPEKDKAKEEDRHPMTQDEKDREARKKTSAYQDWIKYGKQINPTPSSSTKSGSPAQGHQRSKTEPNVKLKPKEPSRHGVGARDSDDGGNRTNGMHGTQANKFGLKPGIGKAASSNTVDAARKHQEKMKNPAFSQRPGVPKGGATRPSSAGERSSPSSVKNTPAKKVLKLAPKEAPAPRPETAGKKRPVKAEPQQSTWDKLYGQYHKKMPGKKRVIESDDEHMEYDELDEYEDDFIDDDGDDMADFIDDGPSNDYSQVIRDIFKYDKRKYKDDVDDTRGMESSYSAQMREETVSARLGLMEDLEDMKKEEEENRQRMMQQKAKKMKVRR